MVNFSISFFAGELSFIFLSLICISLSLPNSHPVVVGSLFKLIVINQTAREISQLFWF